MDPVNGFISKAYKMTEDKIDKSTPALQQVIGDRLKAGQTVIPSHIPKVPTIEIDGFKLPLDAMTLVLYTLIKLAETNEEVRKVLDSFQFKLHDVAKKRIYPPPKP